MASRVARQAFSTTARVTRSVRSNARPPRRFMSADAAAHHDFKPKSDLPWIIGALAISGPALVYLLKDTIAIKQKIAAGHHGHDSHDAHAAHAEAHEEHAAPAVMKDDDGTEADVSNSTNDATAADVPKAAGATSEDSSSDAAAEPPKDEKEESK